jgi:hypothetical protein
MMRGWPVLVALACAVVGAGCGGGSGELSRAEYVRAANRVCRAASTRVQAVRAPDPGDPDAVGRAGSRVVQIQRRALTQLEALKPPAADRAGLVKWIALVDQTLDQARASVRAQRAGDNAAAVTANQHGTMLDARADQIAGRYGLAACGAATARGA